MTSMASWGVTFLAMLRSAVATASSAWVAPATLVRLILKRQQHIAHERPRARQRFHDTRTLARVEFAPVAVLKLLQCSTRQVVGVLLKHLFLRGLDLGERRLNGDDE